MKKPQTVLEVVEAEIIEDISGLGHFIRVTIGLLYAFACILVMYAGIGIVALWTDIFALQVGIGIVLGFAVAKAPIVLIQWLEDAYEAVTRFGHLRAYGAILAVLAACLGVYFAFAPAHWHWRPKLPAHERVTIVAPTVQPVPPLAPAAVLPPESRVRPMLAHLKGLRSKHGQRKRRR